MRNPTIEQSMKYLHPVAIEIFTSLSAALLEHDETRMFYPFETFRSPQRHAYLTGVQPPITRDKQWESPLQYGCAIVYAWKSPMDEWTWDIADTHYNALHSTAKAIGLSAPDKWEKGLIVFPNWPQAILKFLRQ